MKHILVDILKHATQSIIQYILDSKSNYNIHLQINHRHIEYAGPKPKTSEMILIINTDTCTDIKIKPNFISLKKIIENNKTKTFRVPYASIISLYISELDFILEKEKTILYNICNLKKQANKIVETSDKDATILDINNYIKHD